MTMFSVHKPALPAKNVQVQCPSCGASNSNVWVGWRDPRTGQELKDRYGMDPVYGLAVVLVAGASSFLLSDLLLGPDSIGLGLGLTAVISLGIITAYTLRSIRQQGRAVRVHHYECQYCRYKWDWQEGTPVPKYNKRMDIRRDFEEVFGHPPGEEL